MKLFLAPEHMDLFDEEAIKRDMDTMKRIRLPRIRKHPRISSADIARSTTTEA